MGDILNPSRVVARTPNVEVLTGYIYSSAINKAPFAAVKWLSFSWEQHISNLWCIFSYIKSSISLAIPGTLLIPHEMNRGDFRAMLISVVFTAPVTSPQNIVATFYLSFFLSFLLSRCSSCQVICQILSYFVDSFINRLLSWTHDYML